MESQPGYTPIPDYNAPPARYPPQEGASYAQYPPQQYPPQQYPPQQYPPQQYPPQQYPPQQYPPQQYPPQPGYPAGQQYPPQFGYNAGYQNQYHQGAPAQQIIILNKIPTSATCPKCNQSITTEIERRAGVMA